MLPGTLPYPFSLCLSNMLKLLPALCPNHTTNWLPHPLLILPKTQAHAHAHAQTPQPQYQPTAAPLGLVLHFATGNLLIILHTYELLL